MTNKFADAMRDASTDTLTENGAYAKNTSGDRLVDLFGTIGALRNADDARVTRVFADAYAQDPLIATKILFYARDIRGGLGERKTFRTIIRWLATYHPEAVIPNIHLIGEYGRYDDLYALMGTPLEQVMWRFMGRQLDDDLRNMKVNGPVSLLAKWVKTPGVSSKRSSHIGHITAKALGYTDKDFKKVIRQLRKHLDIVERKMSANEWGKIEYSHVPSNAMTNYRNAFKRHDGERFSEYIQKALTPVEAKLGAYMAKIHSETLYPYDIVEKFISGGWSFGINPNLSDDEKKVLEAQWRQLPNYVEDDVNALVIADTSGSMIGRPIASAVGLAIYFAQHNHGLFSGLWMEFSGNSSFVTLKGDTLEQHIEACVRQYWGGSTNLEGAFQKVLDLAIKSHATQEDMPKALIVVSDMEIDQCTYQTPFYDQMRRRYAEAGYEMPTVVFWNVDSRHDTFHADSKRPGVMLCSGQSAGTFRNVIASIGMTPYEAMMGVIDGPRYNAITIGK